MHPPGMPGSGIDLDARVIDTPLDAVPNSDGLNGRRRCDDEQSDGADHDFCDVNRQEALGLVKDPAAQPLGVEVRTNERSVIIVLHTHN
jgi:hypothetical protein